MSTMEHEKLPFLPGQSDETDLEENVRLRPLSTQHTVSRTNKIASLFNAVFLLVNAVLLYRFTSHARPTQHKTHVTIQEATFPPPRSELGLMFKEVDTHHTAGSLYVGEPRPELDQAWSEILELTTVRMSEDEMRTMNKTSVKLLESQGGGYLGYLEVNHMLHCVKRMYQSRHLDYYTDVGELPLQHWDHCVEVLREGIMCNADLHFNTYYWESPKQMAGKTDWPRQCTSWDGLRAWAKDRAVPFTATSPFEVLLPREDEEAIGPVDLLPYPTWGKGMEESSHSDESSYYGHEME